MSNNVIIFFNKVDTTYPILSIESEDDLSTIIDMSQLVFDPKNILDILTNEDGIYKWIGVVYKKRVYCYATTNAIVKIN